VAVLSPLVPIVSVRLHGRQGVLPSTRSLGCHRPRTSDRVCFEVIAPTLDDAAKRFLLEEIETLWLDRGYDSDATRDRLALRGIDDAIIAKKRKRGVAKTATKSQPVGLRWPVERTNSWLSNYGPLRRNTDRNGACSGASCPTPVPRT
jgi:transposase